MSSKRRAVLVLGMHRSGTSAVTRSLNLLGVELGPDLLAPRPDNPTGFWESTEVMELHERLLAALGSRWDDPRPLPATWWLRPEVDPFREELRSLLERRFGGSRLFGVKDPRLSRLAPLWRAVLEELGCEPGFVIVTRDPNEVASSLARRDGFPAWKVHLLWLRHLVEAERSSRGARRALTGYVPFLQDWRAGADRIAAALGIEWPARSPEGEAEIDAFVNEAARHHVSTRSLELDPSLSAWVREAGLALERAAEAPESALETLARLGEQLDASDALHAPWMDESVAEHAELETARVRIADHERQVLWRDSRLAEARDELNRQREKIEQQGVLIERLGSERGRATQLAEQRQLDLDARTQELFDARGELEAERERREAVQAELDATFGALEETRGRLEEMEQRAIQAGASVAQLRSELREFQRVLEGVLASRSWKLTRPLRGLKRLRVPVSWRPLPAGVHETGAALDLEKRTTWLQIVPARPFRQSFTPPVSRLTSLGIYFFTYRRRNTATLDVRLFEEGRLGRPRKLLYAVRLDPEQVIDGEFTEVELGRPIEQADRRRFRIEISSEDAEPERSATVAVAPAYYPARIHSDRDEDRSLSLALEFNPVTPLTTRKAVAFVSGCPGDAYRYRCTYQAEMLRMLGYGVEVYRPNYFPWFRILQCFRVVVCHRVPHTPDFDWFLKEAEDRGVRVVFDTDDLVFDPEALHQIDAYQQMSKAEQAVYADGVRRYRLTLERCHAAIVSTDGLEASLRRCLPEMPVLVSRNRVGEEMRRGAEQARTEPRPDDGAVRIGYFSGTPTHRRDFQECLPALRRVLAASPQARLFLVGHVDPPPELAELSAQIERHPFVHWRELPSLYRRVDLNVAPLERDNDFTEAKSELKYLEAGLMEVPTVASRVGGYTNAVEPERTGFLAGDEGEWAKHIQSLVDDPDLRSRVGRAAHEAVTRRFTTRAAAGETARRWWTFLRRGEPLLRPLSVAFVMRAPIAGTGGGYMKIFQLAHHLARGGNEVHLYVEPAAHLKGLREAEIRAFCEEHFGRSEAVIHVGHDYILASDVAVATNWPTAFVVDELTNARMRAYFVQDYEPEFYDEDDPLRARVETTYDLPLLPITIGPYLAERLECRNGIPYPHVDFALHDAFHERPEDVDRKLAAPGEGSMRVLFFARPEIPRRRFELGVKSLRHLRERVPDVEIALYGMEKPRDLPFPYENLGVLSPEQLAEAMRGADVHLSFSMTNPTTVAFEAMASGCAVVEADTPGMRTLTAPGTCALSEPDPAAVCAALERLARDPERRLELARRGREAARALSVDNMCRQFEALLRERHLGL